MEQNNVIEVKNFGELYALVNEFAEQVANGSCSNPNGVNIVIHGPCYNLRDSNRFTWYCSGGCKKKLHKKRKKNLTG